MSNEEYTHRAEWPEKKGIIETHYGNLFANCKTTAEVEARLLLDKRERMCNNKDFINQILEGKEIVIHRGNVDFGFTADQVSEACNKFGRVGYSANDFLDASEYLRQGSPHIPPIEKRSAVKSAINVHEKVMSMDFKIRTRGIFFIPSFISYFQG